MKGLRELFFYLSVGAGMALATSVFTMISGLFEVASSLWVVLGVVLAGAFCAVIALSVGELASMYPSAPGIRTYLKMAFGDQSSLILVYLYLIFVVVIAGMESYMFARVVGAVFPAAPTVPTVLGLLLFVMAINLAGFELPRTMQMLTASGCILVILVSGVLGLAASKLETAGLWAAGGLLDSGGSAEGLMLLPALAGMAVFLYMGFEWVTPLGLRPSSYQRKIPWSMPVAVAILALTYCLFTLGAASQLSRPSIAGTPVPQVLYFGALYGPRGPYFALALSVSAIFSTFNAGIMGGSRLIFALSREGNLPGWCARRSIRTGAPVGAILLLGVLAMASSVLVVANQAELLAAVIGASIICFVYGAFMLAVLVLRRRKPQARRPFRTPVAAPVQWVLVALLPLMGLQILVSQPGAGWAPAAGAAVCLVLAVLLTRRSLWARARRAAAAAAAPAEEMSAELQAELAAALADEADGLSDVMTGEIGGRSAAVDS